MRSKKTKQKIMIAIALGVVAFLGVMMMINGKNSEVEKLNKQIAEQNARLEQAAAAPAAPAAEVSPPVVDTTNAVSIKTDIKVGDKITIDILEKKEYKKDELPSGYFTNESFILGKTASQAIPAGKILTKDDIMISDEANLDIPDGMRAITIPTSSLQGLASYIFIGSRVDLLAVKSPPAIIAQNVKIIALETAADQAPQPAPIQPPPPVKPADPAAASAPAAVPAPVTEPAVVAASTSKVNLSADKALAITVLVPVNSAQKVIDAIISGKIQVLTRGKSDNKIVEFRSAPPKKISSGLSPSSTKLPALPPPPSIPKLPAVPTSSSPSPAPPPEKPKVIVEVIKGSSRNDVDLSDSSSNKKPPF